MSSRGEGSSSAVDRKVKKETASVIPVERKLVKKEAASVIPVKRKLVKTMAVEAIISAFSPCSSRTSDHSNGNGHGKGNGGRVYPTHP
ncbi:unnamed protein product [Brassica rapa subsp. narinosa]